MINIVQNNQVYEITFPYDANLVELIKNVPIRDWHPDSKLWTIPKDMLGFLLNQLKGTKYEKDINIVSQEDINVNASIGTTSIIPNVNISNVKLYVKEGCSLYNHQLDFMKWALHRELTQKNTKGLILADDPGLGKTLQLTNLALYNKRNLKFKHCLVICCINSSKYNWYDDISVHTSNKYTPYMLGSRLKKDGTFKKDISSKDKLSDLLTMRMYSDESQPELPYFIVTNIEVLRYREGKRYPVTDRIIELINSGDINMIAIDEIHKNASPSSANGKQLILIKKYTQDRCMWIPITGTPIVNRPTDVYLPLKLVGGHDYDNYYMWCKQFCIYGGYGDKEIIGYRNIPKLKAMLQPNMIRRLKEDVLDLPPIIFNDVYVDNTSYQSKLYDSICSEIESKKSAILDSLNPVASLLRLRQVNGSPELVDSNCVVDKSYASKNAKLQELLRLIEEINDRGEKVVVFSNWVEPLRTLYRFISKRYGTCFFTGTISESKRQEQKDIFMTDPKCTVMLGTVGAAGVSHTFTSACNVIFYDEPWTYADKKQAWERVHRIGTTKIVNVYTLLSRNTVDETVHNIVYTKQGVSKFIVDGDIDLRKNPQLFDMLLKR